MMQKRNQVIPQDIADSKQTAFGIRDGRMYAPEEVPSGLACNCTCVGCGAALVAKKGEKKRWHFAHHGVEIGESCAESAIHAAAKQVLLESNWLRTPAMRVAVSSCTKSGAEITESSLLAEERDVRFERSSPEVWETNIRPDVIGYRGERRLLVEMYFRHKVDVDKKAKLAKLGLPSIEIDLTDLDVSSGFKAIEERVLHTTDYKSWLYFPNEEQERKSLRTRLAHRIKQANLQYRAKQAAETARQKARLKKLEAEQKRREAALQLYRQTPPEEKEFDLRQRLGIIGRWPYHLRKISEGGSAIEEKPMIWQAALFSRFIFHRANKNFELKQSQVSAWVLERFCSSETSAAAVQIEVKRYLGYLSACGFLRKLPYNPYESRGYIVVHGDLDPPVRLDAPKAATSTATVAVPRVERTPTRPAPVEAQTLWIWRASWPTWKGWEEVPEEATAILATSPHAEYLEALLHELSPARRPDDPLECAAILRQWGVPQDEVMSFLEKLGLVLRKTITNYGNQA